MSRLSGPKAINSEPEDIFNWPIVTPEVEQAVLDVLRAGKMSGTDVTRQIEDYAAAFRQVTEHAGDPGELGSWGLTRQRDG